MRCKIKIILLTLLLICPCFNIFASADVFTTPKTEGMGDCVYVAGSADMYPMEYYDEENEQFAGIIPQLLERISTYSGIDFVYINGDNPDKESMGNNLQVEIVSSATEFKEKYYCKDYIELVSYEDNGKTERIGLIFTSLASDELIASVKAAAEKILTPEKNGIILSAIGEESTSIIGWVITIILLCIMLIGISVILGLKIKELKQKHISEKMTDPETGMGNLVYFRHHFKYTIGDVARNLYYVAYIMLDGSYLKAYYGEDSFENALKHTSLVLSECANDREVAARINENGFALAFQAASENEATEKIEDIIRRLNEFEDVKEINNRFLFHVAVYNLTIADKNCEMILFNLKKNCKKIFDTEKQIVFCDARSMNMVQEEKKISESILNGLKNEEFKMYLQFVVDNKTKRIVSAEALSRWDSPSKGLISPAKYIEVMETAGLISRHDFYMFDLVCRQLEEWNGTEFGNITISCNFTRITLSEENFSDRLKMIADSYNFDKGKLAIEITEDAIEKNREIATENVKKCKELGFRIYLDDLGSGYTSLANLCDYPIDVVKIDRDILTKTESERGKDLFYGIVALAHSLNMQVICEGVETAEQNEFVSSSECEYIQGWYYSKAFPKEECEEFIKTR